jgi:hypothetical protein
MFFKKNKLKNASTKFDKHVQDQTDESILVANLVKTKSMNPNSYPKSREKGIKSRSNSIDFLRRILYCGGSCYSKSSQSAFTSDHPNSTNASNPLLSKLNDDEHDSNQHVLSKSDAQKKFSNNRLFFNRIKKENLKENLLENAKNDDKTDNSHTFKLSPNFESINSFEHVNSNVSKEKVIPVLKVNDDLIVENSNDDFQDENDENEDVLLENESSNYDMPEIDEDEDENYMCESRKNSCQIDEKEDRSKFLEQVQLGADDANIKNFEDINVTFLKNSYFKTDLGEIENKLANLRTNSNKINLKLSESAHLTAIQTTFDNSSKNKREVQSGFENSIQHLSASPRFDCETNNLSVEHGASLQKTGSLINFFNDKMKQHGHELVRCEQNLSKNSIFSSSIRNSLEEFDKNSESSYDSNILVPLLLLNKRKRSNVSKIDENDEPSMTNKVNIAEIANVRTDLESNLSIQELKKSQSLSEKQLSTSTNRYLKYTSI